MNIYDLELIYAIDIDAATSAVQVKMTLTAELPGSGVAVAEVQAKVQAIEEGQGGRGAGVDRWSRGMMSEAARLELGLL